MLPPHSCRARPHHRHHRNQQNVARQSLRVMSVFCGDSCVQQATLIPLYPSHPHVHIRIHVCVIASHNTLHYPGLGASILAKSFLTPAHRPPVSSAAPARIRHRPSIIPYAVCRNPKQCVPPHPSSHATASLMSCTPTSSSSQESTKCSPAITSSHPLCSLVQKERKDIGVFTPHPSPLTPHISSPLRFQGPSTVVTAVRQFREHAQASRNGPRADFRAPQPLLRPFDNFASMRKRPETALAPISGLRNRCYGRSTISRACASVQKRPSRRFQGSATVVTAVRQFREHAQASRNGPRADFRAPQPLLRPFDKFASMPKRPETALAPISGPLNRYYGRSTISRACASVQKRPSRRFQGSATVVTAVRQFREHAQASRNGPRADFRAPQPLLRPFDNFASMRKRPETALAPISGPLNRCYGRSTISRACASVQKRPSRRFQGPSTVVTAVRQFREHAQASRNGPRADFRAPQPLLRPFDNFASMRKRPETALAPISGPRNRCYGRSTISRACASVQKRPSRRFQGPSTVITAVRQFREHAQASRNGPRADFRAPQPLLRPFDNFASMRKRPETALAPISGTLNRCYGRSTISRACASVQKRPSRRFQGPSTVVTAVRQFREHAQASRNGPRADFRAPQPLLRPFDNFASMRKRPETALAPISGTLNRCYGRSTISRACASVQKRPSRRFQGPSSVVTAVRQFREHAQASRNGPRADFRVPQPCPAGGERRAGPFPPPPFRVFSLFPAHIYPSLLPERISLSRTL